MPLNKIINIKNKKINRNSDRKQVSKECAPVEKCLT